MVGPIASSRGGSSLDGEFPRRKVAAAIKCIEREENSVWKTFADGYDHVVEVQGGQGHDRETVESIGEGSPDPWNGRNGRQDVWRPGRRLSSRICRPLRRRWAMLT